MTSDDLGTALRDRLADVTIDLDALATGATRRGRRIRAARRTGLTLGTVAAVAAVGFGVTALTGSAPSATQQYADEGTSSPTPADPTLAAGQTLPLGHGLTATVEPTAKKDPHLYVMGSSTLPGIGSGYTLVISGPMRQINALWDRGFDGLTELYPGVTFAVDVAVSGNPNPSISGGHAVTVHLDGWKQVGPVGDDKQTLEGPGGAVATLTWRAAADHADWVVDPDKGATSDVWTSPIHDGVFVTVQGGAGTTPATVQALGDSLTWN